jgi:hypothetical protein
MTIDYPELVQRLHRFAFGSRTTSPTSSELGDINAAIKDGLLFVYSSHRWSFLRPSTSITMAIGTYTYDLPTGFDSIEGELTYAVGVSECYPPVKRIKDTAIRKMRQDREYSDRPAYCAVGPKTFDPTIGSVRQLVVYPTPDAAYVLTGTMTLRPTMIDSTNKYPVGGEVLGAVIVEACLAAMELTMDDVQGAHTALRDRLLAAAIEEDKDKSTPESLTFGPSCECSGEMRRCDPLDGCTVMFDDVVI